MRHPPILIDSTIMLMLLIYGGLNRKKRKPKAEKDLVFLRSSGGITVGLTSKPEVITELIYKKYR